jgi:hypothetical protein
MTLVNKVRSLTNPELAHIIHVTDRFQDLLSRPSVDMPAVAGFLDDLAHPVRLAAVRSLKPRHLRHLYDAADGFCRVGIDDVVPKDRGARNPVRHYGKNSLPAFTIFEKRFLRPAEDALELWGYNHQAMSPLTGPGYFVARDNPDRGEVDIDYNHIPPESPPGWPPVVENTRGLSRLVYAYMVDRLRGVTLEVTIGRAWKQGKIQNNWFILCRE